MTTDLQAMRMSAAALYRLALWLTSQADRLEMLGEVDEEIEAAAEFAQEFIGGKHEQHGSD